MLLNDELKIIQIALSCGFYDEAHFCRTFKSITGLTPTEFKHSQKIQA